MTTIKGRYLTKIMMSQVKAGYHPQRQTVQPKIFVKRSVVKLVFMSKYCFEHAHMVAIAMSIVWSQKSWTVVAGGWSGSMRVTHPCQTSQSTLTHYYDHALKFHKAKPLFHPSLPPLTVLCQGRRKLSESGGGGGGGGGGSREVRVWEELECQKVHQELFTKNCLRNIMELAIGQC